MPSSRGLPLPGHFEAFAGERAYRLQHIDAGLPVTVVDDADKAHIGQFGDLVQRIRRPIR